jgi:uncharacterized coiled-coil DUF342 family protein
MKVHRTPPEYTITEDDAEMIAQMVQDRTSEDFENVVHHRDRIQEELADMRQFLKQIGEVQAVDNNIGTGSSTSQTGGEPEASERDTVHTIPQPSATFHITPSMLRMDEIVGKTPLKDLAQLQLVLSRIPSKALHKLQVSVTQEVQSRACTDTTELQQVKDKRDELELIYEQAKLETQEERERVNGLEQKVVGTYEKIPKTAQRAELTTTEKIDQIVQAIDQYQQEIENLHEQLTPTTPPEVREQRKQEATKQIQEIERQVSATADLFDKATQLWMKLEEDQQVQQWDKEEERISATIQDLKQRQKTMSITERVKGVQDMKKLQAELTTAQTQKKECQAQMEPLQERVAEVIAQAEEAKTYMAQTQAECAGLISDEIAVQTVDTLKEKTVQAQTQATELREKFQAITREIDEAHKG